MPYNNNNLNIYDILERVFTSSSGTRGYTNSFDGLTVKDVMVKLFRKLDAIEDDQRAIARKIDTIEKQMSIEDSNRRSEFYQLQQQVRELKEYDEHLDANLKIVNENIKEIYRK